MKKVNNILYAGIFVKEDQLERLFSIEPRPEDSRIIEHPHVTLFFRDNVSLEIMQYVLTHNEQYHSIIVDGIGISDKAIALHVSSIKSETGEICSVRIFSLIIPTLMWRRLIFLSRGYSIG